METREGQDDGVVFPTPPVSILEFADTRVDVAADGENLEIRTQRKKLGRTAERAGADFGVLRKRGDGARMQADENIAWVRAWRSGGEAELRNIHKGHRHGNIFKTVDGKIDFVLQKCDFKFLGEETFASEGMKRLVLNAVTGGGDDDQFNGEVRVNFLQSSGDGLGLQPREQAAAGTEAKMLLGGSGHEYMMRSSTGDVEDHIRMCRAWRESDVMTATLGGGMRFLIGGFIAVVRLSRKVALDDVSHEERK